MSFAAEDEEVALQNNIYARLDGTLHIVIVERRKSEQYSAWMKWPK